MNHFCLVFLLLAIENGLNSMVHADKTLFVEINNADGSLTTRDLIEYIEEGSAIIKTNCNSPIQKQAIMVLGLSGTGKTTLVNYLNGVELVCMRDANRKWIIDVAPNANSLPCGFKIGHGTISQTMYPAVFTPPGKKFSYVDNPGFQDTRGFAMEIANSFFRHRATEQADEFKFLLLITQQDLELRAKDFRETVKIFSKFLGIFSDANLGPTLSKSVAIIVTRVENEGDTDEEMKTYLSGLLLDVLRQERNAGSISPNVEKVFVQLVKDKQVEIFSNPKMAGPVSTKQANQINSLISSMTYISKEDAKFRLAIETKDEIKLFDYIQDRHEAFDRNLKLILHQNISEFVNREIVKAIVVENLKVLETTLNLARSRGTLQKVNFRTFLESLDDNILDKDAKVAFSDQKEILNYFIGLLPVSLVNQLSSDKYYYNEFELESVLKHQIDFIREMYKQDVSIGNYILKIKSCFIKSSEILNFIKKSTNIKAVIVSASQAVYYDAHLELRGLDSLTVISPKWNAEKITIIDLSGHDALPHTTPVLIGNDGLPGRVGQNAGKFYGFGNKFSNLEKLVFNLDGGRGGPGQKGADGVDSISGSQCGMRWRSEQILDKKDLSGGGVTRKQTFYVSYGSVPTNAGNGNLGGKGGKGGLAGSSAIFKLDSNMNNQVENIYNKVGSVGVTGADGAGGKGGKSGCRYKCTQSDMHKEWRELWGTQESNYWVDDFKMDCEPNQPGLTPVIKNEIGLEFPHETPQIVNPRHVIFEDKWEQTLNGYFQFHPSFYNAINKITSFY